MARKMICLGECGKEHDQLCRESGKCKSCCDNECGCLFGQEASKVSLRFADASRYDNLCEAAYLRSLPEVE
jgi:hypothetical protein